MFQLLRKEYQLQMMTEIEMASVTPAVRLRYKPRSRVQAVNKVYTLYLSLHKVFNKFIIKIHTESSNSSIEGDREFTFRP